MSTIYYITPLHQIDLQLIANDMCCRLSEQGDVTHIYTVGRSATGVKLLKINGLLKIFSKVNSQTRYIFYVYSQNCQRLSKISAIKLTIV